MLINELFESNQEQLDELSWKDIQKGAKKIGKGAQKFTKNVADTGAAIGSAARDVGGAIKQVGKTAIADPVSATYNAAKSGLNKAANVAANTYGDVKAGAQKVGRGVDTVAKDVGDAGTWAGEKIKQAGRGVANVAGGTARGIGATAGGATTGLGRAAAHGFNTGVQNVGGNAVDRLQTNVFTPKSTIPNIGYTVPAAAGATAKPAVAKPAAATSGGPRVPGLTNPITGQDWSRDELLAPEPTTATAAPADTQSWADPNSPDYVGRREVARRQAAGQSTAPAKPSFAPQGAGYKPANISFKGMPNVPKAPTLKTATLPAGGGQALNKLTPAQYIQRINATSESVMKNVNKMLESVKTKKDVTMIREYIDTNLVNQNQQAFRQALHEKVSAVSAIKRRIAAQKAAK